MSDVTDAAISGIITAIEDYHKTYFATMAETGFSLQDLKEVKKGAPNPVKWHSPAVYVTPKSVTREGMSETRVTAEILYLLKGRDAAALGKSIARGADALVDLLRARFSLTRVDCEFDYGMTEVGSEAAAQITAEVIT